MSRELGRNGGYDCYRAALADEKAFLRVRRPKRCKLADSAQLRQAVAGKLRLNWSPEQIAGWLTRVHPDDESYRVSHETIYRSLFVEDPWRAEEGAAGPSSIETDDPSIEAGWSQWRQTGANQDLVSIRQRPAAVEDRAVPGHWEGDLLSGSKNSYIATLVERHSVM